MIIDTNPDKAATNIPLNQVITVTFNEEMNPSI
ncbi:Ig-like domain-containing protein [Flavobacterium sp.]